MSGEVAQGCSVSPAMCFADVILTAVNNSYSEQTETQGQTDCKLKHATTFKKKKPWQTHTLSILNTNTFFCLCLFPDSCTVSLLNLPSTPHPLAFCLHPSLSLSPICCSLMDLFIALKVISSITSLLSSSFSFVRLSLSQLAATPSHALPSSAPAVF